MDKSENSSKSIQMFTTGEELRNAVLIWTIDYYTLINSTGQIYAFDWRPIHDVCFMKNRFCYTMFTL